MRYLLDTNILLWILLDDRSRYTPVVEKALKQASTLYISTASLWEIAIKSGLGKLDADSREVHARVKQAGFQILSIEPEHATCVQSIQMIHKDPFDRLLLAQAVTEELMLLTGDPLLRRYDPAKERVTLLTDL